jgi:hypothetical protein
MLSRTSFKVVDVTHPEDDDERWDSRLIFHRLPVVVIQVEHLRADAQFLRQRLIGEMDQYFYLPTEDELIATIVDPATWTTAIKVLRRLGHGARVDRAIYLFKAELLKESKRRQVVDKEPEAQRTDPQVIPCSSSLFQDIMGAEADHTNDDNIDGFVSAQAVADDAYAKWTALSVNWHHFLKAEQKKKDLDEPAALANDCFYLARTVDRLLWFKLNVGSYRLVSSIAARKLAPPSCNALQERVFSFCALIDTKLRQNLSTDKFEMLTVLAFNQEAINCIDSKSSTSLSHLIEHLHCATSASTAAERIIKYYDLDVDDHDGDDSDMASMLREAAENVEQMNSRKRFRP